MSEKSAHHDCKNASNPYHTCSEKCFKHFANCKNASNPYHDCSESCFKNGAEIQKNKQQNDTGMRGNSKLSESSQSTSPSISDRKSGDYVVWSSKLDRLLANLLISQMARANKYDIDQALPAALEFMKSTFHLNVTKDDIKDRIELWKKHYTVVMDVKKQNVLTWDEDRKMIMVTPNEWDKWDTYVKVCAYKWDTYIKSHPDADGMENREIKNWEDIVFLYGKDRASAEDAATSNASLEAIGGEENDEVDLKVTIRSFLEPSNEPNSQEETKKDALLVDALIDAATSIKECFESKKKKEEMQQSSGVEIHKIVSKLPGLAPYEVFQAVQKLMNGNPEQFLLLKSLPDEEKEQWIEFLLLP